MNIGCLVAWVCAMFLVFGDMTGREEPDPAELLRQKHAGLAVMVAGILVTLAKNGGWL